MRVVLAAQSLLLRLLATLLRLLRGAARAPHVPAARASEKHQRGGEAYAQRVAALRETEFARLKGHTYLDHAGAALYSERQLADVTAALCSSLLGNPHSGSEASRASEEVLDAARASTLAYCRAPPGAYVCVFTANATAALKLLGESFPWRAGSRFWHTLESHASVLGIREHALAAGASAAAVRVHRTEGQSQRYTLQVSGEEMRRGLNILSDDAEEEALSLFAYPGECNFSGARMDSALCDALQCCGATGAGPPWMVLIDAAKSCAMHPPDLSVVRPHFVALSYYKIFGWPTGLGALLVRRDALPLLAGRPGRYWGGGATLGALADGDLVARREGSAGLEHGTVAFTAAAAVPRGFACLSSLGGAAAADAHATGIAARLVASLRLLRHADGSAACVVYGWGAFVASTAVEGQGPTVAFNMRTSSGALHPPQHVEQLLSLSNVSLRSGCFCNPGACAAALSLSRPQLVEAHARGSACGGGGGGAHGGGGACVTGALRASFGYSSLQSDADALLSALALFFVDGCTPPPPPPPPPPTTTTTRGATTLRVSSLHLYPLKGGAAWSPPCGAWPLTRAGLLYDRAWAVADADGAVLTQARTPRLAHLRPCIDLRRGTLTLMLHAGADAARPTPPLVLPLHAPCGSEDAVRVCGARRACRRGAGTGTGTGADADAWLSEALGLPCRLVSSDAAEGCAFANEGQLLLLSETSVGALREAVRERSGQEAAASVTAALFRPNLLVQGALPYEEDAWTTLRCSDGGGPLRVTGACARCAQVCLHPTTGRRGGPEPLLTLCCERMRSGRPRFGILLDCSHAGCTQSNADHPAASDQSACDEDWMRRTWTSIMHVGQAMTELY